MNPYTCLFFLNLLHQILLQDCSSLQIEAIYPCTLNFQLDNPTNSCLLSSCITNSPGNRVNQNNMTVCYVSCCPGFPIPAVLSKDNLVDCYNKFNHEPAVRCYLDSLFTSSV